MIRIDKNIKLFVMKLNCINGVYPASSCGGHKNPGGSKQPLGEFFVIMHIWNKEFLKSFYNLCKENFDICVFDYNNLHETWCVHGMINLVGWQLEPFVNRYLANPENIKPENEWLTFYSYGNYPKAPKEFSNADTLAYFKEYSVLWN